MDVPMLIEFQGQFLLLLWCEILEKPVTYMQLLAKRMAAKNIFGIQMTRNLVLPWWLGGRVPAS